MKNFWLLRAATAVILVGLTQVGLASEWVRVYAPATPEQLLSNERLADLENQQGESRTDFLYSFPPTRKLAVKIAVYRDGKLDPEASALFHIYGVANKRDDPKADNASFFTLTRQFPQLSADNSRNGVTENIWGVSMRDYFYGFGERTPTSSTDSQSSADFAETAELRRGKVVMKASTGKFRLSVWVQTVPRKESDSRYGTKRFAVTAPAKPASR